MIRDYLRSQVDHGSSMDTGGGLGCADLWVTFDGKEYTVTVKGGGSEKAHADRMEELTLIQNIMARGVEQAKSETDKARIAALRNVLRMILEAQSIEDAKRFAEEAIEDI
ncbi:hypothetical protein G5V65_11390 [Rhodobacter sp. HX-7-19]|uniref:Uncharacterized protein n=1 Tax=Paragemmobacter kunshanensis TaxID=2583234 RepID=A0A6M1U9Y3_9RHOB|nr:hypothetical protein [Rhodobacter kunshanensis]NGQ91501.1 hypothetical protein [Rhodobacter kunshanensis]